MGKLITILLMGVSLGLADGIINPCVLSLIIFMVSYLLTLSSSPRRILTNGFVFVSGAAITYGLFIYGLVKVIDLFRYGFEPVLLFKILGVILILAALVEIKDFFFYGKGISLKMPEKFKPIVFKLIKAATLPAAFLVGSISALANIPCTGFFAMSYAATVSSFTKSNLMRLFFTVWYLIFFSLPLLAIVTGIYFGFLKVQQIESFYKEKRRYMRLVIGVLLLIVGLLFIFKPEIFARV